MQRLILILIGAATAFLGWRVGRMQSDKAAATQATGHSALTVTTPASEAVRSTNDKPILSEKTDALLERVTDSATFAEIVPDIFEFAKTLRSEDFPSAIAAALTSKNRYAGQLAALLEGYWAEIDLDSAKAWMLGRGTKTLSLGILDAWSRLRPAEMIAWFDALPPDELAEFTREVSNPLTTTLANIAPEKVAKILFTTPLKYTGGGGGLAFQKSDEDPGTAGLAYLFEGWASREPQRAAQFALSLPSGGGRTAAIGGLLAGWSRSDPAGARAWFEALPDPVLAINVLPAYTSALAENNPLAAAALLADRPQTQAIREALGDVARIWAETDLNGALRWAQETDPESRTGFCERLMRSANEMDPRKAAAAILDEPTLVFGGTPGLVAASLVKTASPEEALRFLEKLPEVSRKSATFGALGAWILKSPEAVEHWALEQSEGEARSIAFERLAATRLERDPATVSNWIKGLPRGPSRDLLFSRRSPMTEL
jgi:hypothetical protein